MDIINCMIVDDEPLAREIIVNYCAHLAFLKVTSICSNAIEARNILQQQPVEILFLDINMPVMNGIECLTLLMHNPHLKEIPVIVLTTSSYHSENAIRLGAKAYLKKPSDVKVLKKQIEYMLNFNFKTDTFNIGTIPY